MNSSNTIPSDVHGLNATHLTSFSEQSGKVEGGYVELSGERWYKITNSDRMDEFFICPVSSSDHWMFITSQGALSAGRRSPDSALFPYYSSDKIIDTSSTTGSKTILQVSRDGREERWEPFARRDVTDASCESRVARNLYKNFLGNRILFEEIHHELELAFRYSWTFSNQFGFVRHCQLLSFGRHTASIKVLDGIQNLVPYGLDQRFQMKFSNLGDAYKKCELLDQSQVGLYYLSSIPTDRAEPSEGLRATIAWSTGLDQPKVLLSSQQLDRFVSGEKIRPERDIRGMRGAYFVVSEMKLGKDQPESSWQIVADVNQNHSDVARLHHRLSNEPHIEPALEEDIARNQDRLLAIVSATDGRQKGSSGIRIQRHQSNVLFNVMRGGIPRQGYQVCTAEFRQHVQRTNRDVFDRQERFLNELPESIESQELLSLARTTNDPNLRRIASEYLPLTYSRRHGDPTRPWNAFSINFVGEDGSESLGYEGNWRDIFQNWEALAVSYPRFCNSMIFRFVNASTADGYNPYRITNNGIDWETIDPEDPWSNIGYWGDHQIIYLLRLLEWSRRFDPQALDRWLEDDCFSYTQVPYRIRSYAQTCLNPRETIDFDDTLADAISERVKKRGEDGKLMQGSDHSVIHVSLFEKLLVPALVKLSNLIPEGGIWMNTQRPEWNDANNALAGLGLSVVTAGYLRRYFAFLREWLADLTDVNQFQVSAEVVQLLEMLHTVLQEFESLKENGDVLVSLTDLQRKKLVDGLSNAGSEYRLAVYDRGLTGERAAVQRQSCLSFLDRAIQMIDQTLRSNKRTDGLYHSYNLLELGDETASVEHLYEMLEGQVSILSSGVLSSTEAADVFDALRDSKIYRADQESYMLYPDRSLPRFMDKNRVASQSVSKSRLLKQLLKDGDKSIVESDIEGRVHFNGDFRNQDDVQTALGQLSSVERYKELVLEESSLLCDIFEETFEHRNFTGRSGTFFGYEGLGSIYWHMVSKLALAAIEGCVESDGSEVTSRLREQYREIRDGIGVTKSPSHYGAFPSDPYSHTPEGAGVKQPGMTGQVKEDVLSRMTEIGVRIESGVVSFDPSLFESHELLTEPDRFDFVDLSLRKRSIDLGKGEFAFTLCQVPVIYQQSMDRRLSVRYSNGQTAEYDALSLSRPDSTSLFDRSAKIERIDVFVNFSR